MDSQPSFASLLRKRSRYHLQYTHTHTFTKPPPHTCAGSTKDQVSGAPPWAWSPPQQQQKAIIRVVLDHHQSSHVGAGCLLRRSEHVAILHRSDPAGPDAANVRPRCQSVNPWERWAWIGDDRVHSRSTHRGTLKPTSAHCRCLRRHSHQLLHRQHTLHIPRVQP